METFGVALGGGGAKGIYQIGAISALYELNIKISAVVGTSIGALNGAFIAQHDFKKLENIWNNFNIDSAFSVPKSLKNPDNLFSVRNFPAYIDDLVKKKGIDITPLRDLLKNNIDEEKLRISDCNFGLATFSLSDFKPVKMFIDDIPKGKVVEYLLASAGFPGLQPVKIEKSTYIDGGVWNNVPGDMLVELGIDNIICIDNGNVPGVTRRIDSKGLNIIHITPSIEFGAVFDFNKSTMEGLFKLGYYDTMREFGRLKGYKYYFEPEEFEKLKSKLDFQTICDLEDTAEQLGLHHVRKYTAEEFIFSLSTKIEQQKSTYNQIKNSGLFIGKLSTFYTTGGKNFSIDKNIIIPFLINQIECNSDNSVKLELLSRVFKKEYEYANAIIKLYSLIS